MAHADLLPDARRARRPRRWIMHFVDGGVEALKFACKHCGYSAWYEFMSVAEAKRGIPCPRCNDPD